MANSAVAIGGAGGNAVGMGDAGIKFDGMGVVITGRSDRGRQIRGSFRFYPAWRFAIMVAVTASLVPIGPSGPAMAAPAGGNAAAVAGVSVGTGVPESRPVIRPVVHAYQWPLAGSPAVVVPFDAPARPWLPGHRGVDLASTVGATVQAAGAGTIAFAGTVAGVGVVSIDHAGGLRTTYEPVQPTVAVGTPVRAGTRIGRLLAGHPSCPPGVAACLHWGLRRGATYLDPLLLLGLGPVRLLPAR